MKSKLSINQKKRIYLNTKYSNAINTTDHIIDPILLYIWPVCLFYAISVITSLFTQWPLANTISEIALGLLASIIVFLCGLVITHSVLCHLQENLWSKIDY